MVVMPETRIESASQTVRLKDLGEGQNRQVSIKFVPERRGDGAEWIRVGGYAPSSAHGPARWEYALALGSRTRYKLETGTRR